MPSVSVAQRKKMAVLHKQGKISDAAWEDFKKVVPKKRAKRKARKKGRKR